MNRWYRSVTVDLPEGQFGQLPRHPAYEYAWWDGKGHLVPFPRLYHCRLTIDSIQDESLLASRCADQGVRLRPVEDDDWLSLVDLFDAAFCETVPFCTLEAGERNDAAFESLQQTRRGDDGPLVVEASRVALSGNDLLGAILVTLIPPGDLERFDEPQWLASAPDDAVARRWGRPHITWIFVAPPVSRSGLGSLLLQGAVAALGGMGYRELVSTVCSGNVPSLLWHWRNRFELLSWPGSPRSAQPDDLPRN